MSDLNATVNVREIDSATAADTVGLVVSNSPNDGSAEELNQKNILLECLSDYF